MAAGDPREWVTWQYTTDRGVDYKHRVSKYITDQGGVGTELVGGEAASPSLPELRELAAPRVVLCYNSTKKLARRVICYTTTSPLYAGTSDEIQLYCGVPSALTTFKVYGYEGERTRTSRQGL